MIVNIPYWTRVAKNILYVVLLIIGLYLALKLSIFYMPFLIAFIISLMIEPLIKYIMKKTKLTRRTSSIIIFIIVSIILLGILAWIIITLFSMDPWFLWPFYNIKVLLIAFFCFLCFPFLKFKTKYLSSLLMCFLLWVYLYFYHATTSLSILSTFLIKFLPLSFVINFSDKEKLLYIECLTKVFSYILLISLIFYLLWHIGVAFPKSLLKHPVNSFYGLFENYYMFIVAGNYGLFTRFQSIFTEPGHLGMFSAILLYVNRYDFSKWYTWVIFLSLLLSFFLRYILY